MCTSWGQVCLTSNKLIFRHYYKTTSNGSFMLSELSEIRNKMEKECFSLIFICIHYTLLEVKKSRFFIPYCDYVKLRFKLYFSAEHQILGWSKLTAEAELSSLLKNQKVLILEQW